MSAGTASLAGRGILVTRPRERAGRLAQALRAAGAEPVLFPAVEIAAVEVGEVLASIIDGLDRCDLAVFVSETAVAMAERAVRARRAWPSSLAVAAVGASTARALREIGFGRVVAPAQPDSESLAALPDLAGVAGKTVVIFRGEGGREWLRQELESRGATVRCAQCYVRRRPAGADPVALLSRWERGGIDAVSVTSIEGLSNLFDMLGPQGGERLRATPLFVPHPRIADEARRRGVRSALPIPPGESETVAAMSAFFAKVSPT